MLHILQMTKIAFSFFGNLTLVNQKIDNYNIFILVNKK